MEFYVDIIKVVAVIVSILVLLSVVSLFIRRYRKTGLIVLCSTIALILLIAAYYLSPRTYERHYLQQGQELSAISLRQEAERSRFYLGTAINAPHLGVDEVNRSFNSLTPENDLKLGLLIVDKQIGVYDFSTADSIVDFAIQNNFRIRGHTLVWGKLSSLFKHPDLDAYLSDFPEQDRPEILKNLVESHIKVVLTRYQGKIAQWDVVNEPLEILGSGELEENVFYRYLGPGYIESAFRLAHELDPQAELFLNELLFNYHDERAEAYYQFVLKMKEDGVPIHGVGFQSHVLYSVPSMDNIKSYIKKFTDLGLKVEFTEVDARLRLFNNYEDPYRAQAEFYGQLLGVCLDNPGCTGITFWGYTDAACWLSNQLIFPEPNEPFLFDRELNPKPVIGSLYQQFREY
jgi:endo-1,4-beta-xylanase